METTNFPDKFKASKGWYEKFILRFNKQFYSNPYNQNLLRNQTNDFSIVETSESE